MPTHVIAKQTANPDAAQLAIDCEASIDAQLRELKIVPVDFTGYQGTPIITPNRKIVLRRASLEPGERSIFYQWLVRAALDHQLSPDQLFGICLSRLVRGAIKAITSRDDVPLTVWDDLKLTAQTRHLTALKWWHENSAEIPYEGTMSIDDILKHSHWREWREREQANRGQDESPETIDEGILRLIGLERVEGVVGLSLLAEHLRLSRTPKAEAPDGKEEEEPKPSSEEPPNLFRVEGDFTALRFGGGTISRVRTLEGIRHLAHLIENPGKRVHCVDLHGITHPRDRDIRAEGVDGRSQDELEEQGLGGDSPLDSLEDSDMKKTLKNLLHHQKKRRTQIDEAQKYNDSSQVKQLTDLLAEEEEFIALYIKENFVGTGDKLRPRIISGEAEKARKAVAIAIRRAITRIGKELPELAEHIEGAVIRGTKCIYTPEKSFF